MTAGPARFTLPSRVLHWLMAPMVIAQLLVGVTMVAALSYNRLTHRPPAFLATMSKAERRVATWSEYLLYGLLLVQPLIGWAMLSAARFPVTLLGPVALPGIAPRNIDVFALLRQCHAAFALLLFLTFTAHMTAVLFHTLVLRDRLLDRMALWRTKAGAPD
jgi:cytochrome b561